jgi:transposase
MRGRRNPQVSMLAFVDLEEGVPPDHPLRTIKRLAEHLCLRRAGGEAWRAPKSRPTILAWSSAAP